MAKTVTAAEMTTNGITSLRELLDYCPNNLVLFFEQVNLNYGTVILSIKTV